jgi:hypothetical protein
MTTATTAAGIGDIGGAVTDIFGAYGDMISAGAYEEAAALEKQAAALSAQDINLVAASTATQVAQTQRQINLALGGQEGAVAGAGFAESGTALWLQADSMRQGALAKSLIKTQGAITQQGYQIQELSEQSMAIQDTALAQQAKAGATGDIIGAGLGLAAAAVLLL